MEHLIGEAECGYLIPIYLLITCDNIFQNYNPVSEKTFKSEKQLIWESGVALDKKKYFLNIS